MSNHAKLTITYTKKKKKRLHGSDTVESTYSSNLCQFCLSSENVEELYGKFIRKCGFYVHYFCMLFASGLSQRGKTDTHGILGFMPKDIHRELKRGNRLRCSYCKNKGATIGCVVTSCRRVFHLTCGRNEGSLHQFYDIFRSYCPDHRPLQPVQISDRLAFKGTANTVCSICMYSVVARSSPDTLRAPCCKNSWFHYACIQRYALSAGLYFFKCPLCNSKDLFQAEMLQYGVYIPDQDAAWEREPNAYQDLYDRYAHCDAVSCLCPQGRSHDEEDRKWEIVVCESCGSHGSHLACRGLKSTKKGRICAGCEAIDHNCKHKGKKNGPKLKNRTQSELQKLLKERVDQILLAQSKSKQTPTDSEKNSSIQLDSDRSKTNRRRRNLRSQGEPSVVMDNEESDCFVDVEALNSSDEDSTNVRKRRRLSLSITQSTSKTNPRRSSTVTSNIDMSGEQSCSASIETRDLASKYSNYVTVSTVRQDDIRNWGTSGEGQASTSQAFPIPFCGDDEELDEDSLFMDMSDSSDDEICAIDEVHEDDTKRTVMIKWKGKRIRIYKEVEKNAYKDISKWSLRLEVGDSEDCSPAKPSSPAERSPPQLVPIDDEIAIRCTPPTKPYMLNVPALTTSSALHSSRDSDRECRDTLLRSTDEDSDSRVTRSMSVEAKTEPVDGASQSVSERKSRHSRRSLEQDFSAKMPDRGTQWKRDPDVESVTSSVITISSNASDGDESDCLIVEPVFAPSNRQDIEHSREPPRSTGSHTGSPFQDGVYPGTVPFRQISSGHGGMGMIIDLTDNVAESHSETWEGFANANNVSSPRVRRSQSSHNS